MYTGYLPSGDIFADAARWYSDSGKLVRPDTMAAIQSIAPMADNNPAKPYADSASILSKLGMSPTEAPLVIVILFQAPAYCDPAAIGVQVIVKAIQRYLGEKGWPTLTNGRPSGKINPGDATDVTLQKVLGTSWRTQTWNAIAMATVAAPTYKNYAALDQTRVIPKSGIKPAHLMIAAALGVGALMYFSRKGK